ncbi:unnamed protein product [Adineta ricciae]|uniref:Uncharacterized protein n=1 Tax=Adineta ricciae TaxID=249248 RepID=A0A814I8U5_ADIRI|nr:unnamed protein product [Adineta ricciae]
MLSQFRSQFFQLPLISSTWTWIGHRYQHTKENSLFPIRLLLTIVEQTILLVYRNLIRPLPQPYHSLLNSLDNFLCSHVTSLQYCFPFVNQTFDELTDSYGDLFSLSIFTNGSKSASVHSTTNVITNIRRERKSLKLFDRYFQFLTDILMSIEIYSKSIENELTDYIDTSRNLWKNLNMEDGRSLDEVESFSEKLLVLGRRITGNYRQLVYLIGYQFKRCRYILFSCLYVHKRFQSTAWRITRKIQMKQINQKLNDGARYGLVSSKQRVHYYLEMMMLHAAKHPWMRWLTPQTSESYEPELSKPLKSIRPMFFVPSDHTSDYSGSEENLRDHYPKLFESTPYRRNINIIQSKQAVEDVLSNISSTSSTISEQSFDVKDILRQVGSQTRPTIDSTPSTDEDNQTEIIEQAFNDDHDQQQQQSISVFDLSPMLASGCAV